MAGDKSGGVKAKETNLKRNPNFYKEIGAKGGKNGTTGGFASALVGDDGMTGRQRAKVVGIFGGRKSKRGSSAS